VIEGLPDKVDPRETTGFLLKKSSKVDLREVTGSLFNVANACIISWSSADVCALNSPHPSNWLGRGVAFGEDEAATRQTTTNAIKAGTSTSPRRSAVMVDPTSREEEVALAATTTGWNVSISREQSAATRDCLKAEMGQKK
jgi:hypothetical protein